MFMPTGNNQSSVVNRLKLHCHDSLAIYHNSLCAVGYHARITCMGGCDMHASLAFKLSTDTTNNILQKYALIINITCHSTHLMAATPGGATNRSSFLSQHPVPTKSRLNAIMSALNVHKKIILEHSFQLPFHVCDGTLIQAHKKYKRRTCTDTHKSCTDPEAQPSCPRCILCSTLAVKHRVQSRCHHELQVLDLCSKIVNWR